jgi:hypothetical protein
MNVGRSLRNFSSILLLNFPYVMLCGACSCNCNLLLHLVYMILYLFAFCLSNIRCLVLFSVLVRVKERGNNLVEKCYVPAYGNIT